MKYEVISSDKKVHYIVVLSRRNYCVVCILHAFVGGKRIKISCIDQGSRSHKLNILSSYKKAFHSIQSHPPFEINELMTAFMSSLIVEVYNKNSKQVG